MIITISDLIDTKASPIKIECVVAKANQATCDKPIAHIHTFALDMASATIAGGCFFKGERFDVFAFEIICSAMGLIGEDGFEFFRVERNIALYIGIIFTLLGYGRQAHQAHADYTKNKAHGRHLTYLMRISMLSCRYGRTR